MKASGGFVYQLRELQRKLRAWSPFKESTGGRKQGTSGGWGRGSLKPLVEGADLSTWNLPHLQPHHVSSFA